MNRLVLIAAIAAAGIGHARAGCEIDAPKFGPFLAPPQSGRIVLEVRFYPKDEVAEVCRKVNGLPEGSKGPPACITDRFTPGVFYVHVPLPADWDDCNALNKLAHEILHPLKAEHR